MPRELESSFAESLLDPRAPIPAGVTAWNGAARSRFGVYRNNVTVSLVEALAKRFPVVMRLVGDEFFRAMAAEFVRASPPRSPLLHLYGDAFAAFIAAFPPAAPVPYLADTARLEYAFGLAWHAADAVPLSPEDIRSHPEETWGELVFALHPSLRLVSSRWPIVAIWAANTHDDEVKPVDLDAGEDALVLRPGLEVTVRALPPGAFAFLAALETGAPLAVAAETARDAAPAFDLAANLTGLIGAGLAVGVRHPAEAEEARR